MRTGFSQTFMAVMTGGTIPDLVISAILPETLLYNIFLKKILTRAICFKAKGGNEAWRLVQN